MNLKFYSAVLAVCVLLFLLTFSFATLAQRHRKAGICHKSNDGSWKFTATSGPDGVFHPDPSSANRKDHHESDFFANSAEECGRGKAETAGPDALPEPVTMVIFGASLAGAGYATRRWHDKGKVGRSI